MQDKTTDRTTAPFTFNTTKSIVFGPGKLSELPSLLAPLSTGAVFMVTDPGLLETGLVERAEQALTAAGRSVTIFSEVKADPPEAVILAATEAARVAGAEVILGLGGGSSLDVAKLVSALMPGHQTLSQMYGVGNVTGARLPLTLVPTTAGTGSEVTPISIVTTGAQEKMGVVSPVMLPDLAILDPELTIGLPAHVTAATGIDAMVHAIEDYASRCFRQAPCGAGLCLWSTRCQSRHRSPCRPGT